MTILRIHSVTKHRSNVEFSTDYTEVSYNEQSFFHFNRAKSVAGLDDYKVTAFNLAFVSLFDKLHNAFNENSLLAPLAKSFMKTYTTQYKEFLIGRFTPREIINGRKLNMFRDLRRLLTPFAGILGKGFVDQMPEVVGYLARRNATISPKRVIFTGRRSFADMVIAFESYYGRSVMLRALMGMMGVDKQSYAKYNDGEEGTDEGGEVYQRKVGQVMSIDNRK